MRHSLKAVNAALPMGDRLAVVPDVFDDPRVAIFAGVLGPGTEVHRGVSSPAREEVWIVLDPGVSTLGKSEEIRSEPGLLAGFSGSSHGLAYRGSRFIRYLRVGMGSDVIGKVHRDDGDDPEWEPLDPLLLEPFKAHLGLGDIRFRRLWDHDRFSSGWGFVDHVIVDPGTSVGYHRHDTVQECYLILSGNGVMKVDDTVFDFGPGDCVPNRLGGAHGLIAREEPTEFINVALFTAGRFDATDLGDDLADCI